MLIGKIREIRENLSVRGDPKAKAQLDFTRKAEKLFMQALSEAGGTIDATGKIHIANREEEKEKSPDEGGVRRLAKQRISDAVDKAIANKGKIGEKYNQMPISAVPRELATLVNKASNSLIDISNKVVAVNGDNLWHEYDRHSNIKIEQGRQQIAFTPQEMKEAIEAIYSPDVVESVFSDKNNPTQRQSFAYAKKSAQGHYIVVEAVGGKQNPNIVPAMILQFSEDKWNKMMSEGKTLGELFYENDAKLRGFLDIEFNKKNRVTAAQFASQEAIANTPHSPRSTISISNSDQIVNPSAQEISDKVSRSRNASKTMTLSKGQIAALRANYKGDKVFTKKDVATAVKSIDALQKLPAATRNELVTHLWRGYNERLNEQGFDMFTEIMWHKIHAEILQETGFEMTEDEIRAMDEQIVNALHTIVKSGKPSVRAKLESATSTEGYRKQANFWRGDIPPPHFYLHTLLYKMQILYKTGD